MTDETVGRGKDEWRRADSNIMENVTRQYFFVRVERAAALAEAKEEYQRKRDIYVRLKQGQPVTDADYKEFLGDDYKGGIEGLAGKLKPPELEKPSFSKTYSYSKKHHQTREQALELARSWRDKRKVLYGRKRKGAIASKEMRLKKQSTGFQGVTKSLFLNKKMQRYYLRFQVNWTVTNMKGTKNYSKTFSVGAVGEPCDDCPDGIKYYENYPHEAERHALLTAQRFRYEYEQSVLEKKDNTPYLLEKFKEWKKVRLYDEEYKPSVK